MYGDEYAVLSAYHAFAFCLLYGQFKPLFEFWPTKRGVIQGWKRKGCGWNFSMIVEEGMCLANRLSEPVTFLSSKSNSASHDFLQEM